MSDWWDSGERRWLRRHAVAAPFGILVVTILLGYILYPEQWASREGLKSASSLVDLGAVIYAAVAVLAERGVRVVFWALDERRKWRAKWRAEAQAEGRAEGHAAGRAEGHSEGRAEGRAEGRVEGHAEGQAETLTALLEEVSAEGNHDLQELIARVAKEKGISLNGDSKE